MKSYKPLIPFKHFLTSTLKLSRTIFDHEGRLVLGEPYVARLISYQFQKSFDKNILPGKLNSLAVLDGLFDFLMNKFDDELSPQAIEKAADYLEYKLGHEDYKQVLKIYLSNFPTEELFDKIITEEKINDYLKKNELRELFVRNLILIYLSNQNKAADDLKFIFNDDELISNSNYLQAIKILEEYFDKIRIKPLKNKSLIEFLFEPILISPDNIEGQLNFIRENWKDLIPEDIINQILKAIDLIKEDAKIFQTGTGTGETIVPTFSLEELLGFGDKFKGNFYPITPVEEEKFTPDTDWMPKVVLLAKNIYVWLYQLSKKYNQEIRKLDQIPDEELDTLASYGFNALWLIGIWERSTASRKIKQLSGNPEALASAYSIYDYVISNDLGGEEAYQNLNQRCWNRGIRLACDIVPNHAGIFSRWLMEFPDYFIQTDYPPFPSYSFTGPNLSDNPDFQIRIEDKYWTRQDAAVVFQLIENKTGRVRYIYHGNDGTNMPWNDTAQLNLLKPEVREALYQLILNIARKFSIIRLDAAMTLTQKHYQRLWYPVPGTGGAIPSRADFSMSTDEFLRQYPKEFWREVIDRINIDKPDTLLLAEAFWLMEGYFVRTLGMHRVYNSAFMNMLKNEENAKYRDLISNTLEFNPEILKRYVNFLSNPDEETAINQFGDGDKYFGCCVMMVTMPGLPMFAHGQIEGLREKYGHEYSRAYYDEQPNQYMVERHKREIFPLIKKRYLFSQVQNFELFDFKDEFGQVIENVFAYSNRTNNEAALIFYNNSFSTYYGYIDFSAPKNYGSSESEVDKKLISKSLGEALGIKNSEHHFYIFKETRSNLEFIKRGADFYNEKFFIELKGYEYKVFIDFVELYDHTGELNEFYHSISRAGVQSINSELIKFHFLKIVNDISSKINTANFTNSLKDETNAEEFIYNIRDLFKKLSDKLKIDRIRLEVEIFSLFKSIQNSNLTLKRFRNRKSAPKWLKEFLEKEFSTDLLQKDFYTMFVANFINGLEEHSQLESSVKKIFIEELLNQLTNYSERAKVELTQVLMNTVEREINFNLINKPLLDGDELRKLLLTSLDEEVTKNFIDLNEYESVTYYNKENFEEFIQMLSVISFVKQLLWNSSTNNLKKSLRIDEIQKSLKVISVFLKQLKKISLESQFRFTILKEKLQF